MSAYNNRLIVSQIVIQNIRILIYKLSQLFKFKIIFILTNSTQTEIFEIAAAFTIVVLYCTRV